MKITQLPGTGLRVSAVCLGTMTFGGQVNEGDGIRVLQMAVDHGINFVDTADMYTGGESERIVGKGLKGIRDKVVLATKVCNATGPNPNDQGLSRIHIRQAVDASLRRLQTDYIDVYYLHRPDRGTPLEETMSVIDDLIHEGKIRYVGVSNFSSWAIADILAHCDKRNYANLAVNQSVYNLLTRGIEDELLPMSIAHQLGVVVYNPLASGLLTGKHTGDVPQADSRLAQSKLYHDRYWNKPNSDAVVQLKQIAEDEGISLLEMSLRWCANQTAISSVLVGVSRVEQLNQNIECLEKGPLSDTCLDRCDQVWNSLPIGSRFKYYR